MPEHRFRQGDVVEFDFGIYHVQGVVKEDRGPIGLRGRRLYLLEFRRSPSSETVDEIELPAERLQLVAGAASTK
jgi:hypothetical protein